MPDKEKVIESLNKALTRVGYGDMDNVTLSEVEEAIESAIALLREQEPVKPITQDAWPNPVKVCGSCGRYITYTAGRPRFCPNCGSEMKWDE